MLRFLIGAACVAVIAFVGYFFWSEQQAKTAASIAQAAAIERAACIDAARRYVANIIDHADKDRCVAVGLISPQEVEALANGKSVY